MFENIKGFWGLGDWSASLHDNKMMLHLRVPGIGTFNHGPFENYGAARRFVETYVRNSGGESNN